MYLNIDEVESALVVATSAPYDGFTELITLPHKTWEGRTCHAIKIANGNNPNRPGVFFLGGLHAREWGSPDILISFIEQLEQAYVANTGITLGGKTYSASVIQTMVNTLDIYVFPQANPDGRLYSMTNDDPNTSSYEASWWRKNRRTLAPNNATGDCVGVDLNRNFDFLWDFPNHFNSASPIQDSTNVCDHQLYNGEGAFSEPETQNAKWIFDTYGNIGFFVDLHSYSQDILYSWGDDDDQNTNPSMNFQNPAYDTARGILDSSGSPEAAAYRDYIPSRDQVNAEALANTLAQGIQSVRGTVYTVKSSANLYPTAGTSTDYAYSRSFVDPSKTKIFSYTIEWGTIFIPLFPEMQNIIDEVTSGLLSFCQSVRNSIQSLKFVINRSTLGQDEIDARRAMPGGAVVSDAFRVQIDGFNASELGITGPASKLNVAAPVPGMNFICTGNFSDNGDYGPEFQLFTFLYNIDFGADDTAFSFAAATETLNLTVSDAGLTAPAQIELMKQPDPFILHGDTYWLSVDLRVFVARAGETLFGATMGNDANSAPEFIQNVMAALNQGGGSAGGSSFGSLSADEEASSLFINPADDNGDLVFNFALAKVHCIGTIGASKVRVFFRLFQAQTTNTTFQPTTTYRRAPTNPHGQPIALPGINNGEYVTIPFFASPRVDSTTTSLTQQTDDDIAHGNPINVQDIVAIGGPEVDHFFGCWLDINQPYKTDGSPNNVLPMTENLFAPDGPFTDFFNPPMTIQQAILRNRHQCLVAEIAFDPVSIPVGKDPSNWDKLAQRNLAWSDLPNPGADGTRLAVNTFEIRPSPSGLAPNQLVDELMIDWNEILTGTLADIYIPSVPVDSILKLARKMYSSHHLTKLDDHTLQCRITGGITYIPVPPGTSSNYAGILTISLPPTLRNGEIYTVVVRQVTNAFGIRGKSNQPSLKDLRETKGAATSENITWRKVLGAFQITIPIKTKEVMIAKEERELSVLKWIGETIPPQNRWYPVFNRYLHQLGGRLQGFGGDPFQILPSPTGAGLGKPHPGEHHHQGDLEAHTGKITELEFDRFGDFYGFLLVTDEGQRHHFYSRHRDIKELAERAWRERLRITVWTKRDESHDPASITIHELPMAF